MRLIENLLSKFKKKEARIVTTRDLTDYMINDRVMFIPNYNEREYIKARKKTQYQVRKNLER